MNPKTSVLFVNDVISCLYSLWKHVLLFMWHTSNTFDLLLAFLWSIFDLLWSLCHFLFRLCAHHTTVGHPGTHHRRAACSCHSNHYHNQANHHLPGECTYILYKWRVVPLLAYVGASWNEWTSSGAVSISDCRMYWPQQPSLSECLCTLWLYNCCSCTSSLDRSGPQDPVVMISGSGS